MVKGIKNKYIGARVENGYFDKVLAYIDATPLETQGQLVRAAVDEYMLSHPIKETPTLSPANSVVTKSIKGDQ